MKKKNLLFVCTGNTCRSPLAEAYLMKYGKAHFNVKSAGIAAADGAPLSEGTAHVLKKEGLAFEHASKPVTKELIQWSDVILTMSSSQREELERRYPNQAVHTLKEAAGKEGFDIADPFGGSIEEYEQTADDIKRAIKAYVKQAK